MSSSSDVRRTVRFFTNTRRIPVLIGKIGGTRMPGGPFTAVQLLIGATTLTVGYQLMPLWGPLVGTSPLVWMIALVVISAGVTIAAGRIPSTRRKVNNIAVDAVGAVASSSAGTYNNRPVAIPRPHRVTGTVLVAHDAPPLEVRGPLTAASTAPRRHPATTADPQPGAPRPTHTPHRRRAAVTAVPVMAVAPLRYATGVDRLLAQARAGKEA